MQLKKSTFDILQKIEKNNNREWFTAHKEAFKSEEKLVKDFYQAVMDELNKVDHIEKFHVFRIYRDVRFSKDKTPYKTYFGGGFKRTGKSLRGGYYLHIQPGNTHLAGGFFNPNSADLKRIRKEFEVDPSTIRALLKEPKLKRTFGTFLGEQVKTAPRGFDPDHPAIDLLRFKQFYLERSFTDKQVLSKNFLKTVVESFILLRPYLDYMTHVLTTDANGISLL